MAVLLLLTSALSGSPFSHSFISSRHCSFPTGPLTAQLAGVVVRSQPQLSPSPALFPFQRTSIYSDMESWGWGGGAAGHSHWRWVNRGPFQFFIDVIWPLSPSREGRGCPFDFFLEDRLEELSFPCVWGRLLE